MEEMKKEENKNKTEEEMRQDKLRCEDNTLTAPALFEVPALP